MHANAWSERKWRRVLTSTPENSKISNFHYDVGLTRAAVQRQLTGEWGRPARGKGRRRVGPRAGDRPAPPHGLCAAADGTSGSSEKFRGGTGLKEARQIQKSRNLDGRDQECRVQSQKGESQRVMSWRKRAEDKIMKNCDCKKEKKIQK